MLLKSNQEGRLGSKMTGARAPSQGVGLMGARTTGAGEEHGIRTGVLSVGQPDLGAGVRVWSLGTCHSAWEGAGAGHGRKQEHMGA